MTLNFELPHQVMKPSHHCKKKWRAPPPPTATMLLENYRWYNQVFGINSARCRQLMMIMVIIEMIIMVIKCPSFQWVCYLNCLAPSGKPWRRAHVSFLCLETNLHSSLMYRKLIKVNIILIMVCMVWLILIMNDYRGLKCGRMSLCQEAG